MAVLLTESKVDEGGYDNMCQKMAMGDGFCPPYVLYPTLPIIQHISLLNVDIRVREKIGSAQPTTCSISVKAFSN